MPDRIKVEKIISRFGGKLTTLLAGMYSMIPSIFRKTPETAGI